MQKTVLNDLIDTFNGDIRQILNYLNMNCSKYKMTQNSNAEDVKEFQKDSTVQLDMWSATNKLLNRVEF